MLIFINILKFLGVVVHWSRQLRIAVSDSDQTSHTELLSLIDEYNFWIYRWENLSGLSYQLKSKSVKHLLDILTVNQSSYIKPFQALIVEILDATNEAKNNIEYLQILKQPCEELAQEKSPSQMTNHIPKLLNLFRIIWMHSPYYNTKEKITLLCRNLSNQIILQCKNSVDLDSILLKGLTCHGIKVLEENIDCCLKYKVIYDVVGIYTNTVKIVQKFLSFEKALFLFFLRFQKVTLKENQIVLGTWIKHLFLTKLTLLSNEIEI